MISISTSSRSLSHCFSWAKAMLVPASINSIGIANRTMIKRFFLISLLIVFKSIGFLLLLLILLELLHFFQFLSRLLLHIVEREIIYDGLKCRLRLEVILLCDEIICKQ